MISSNSETGLYLYYETIIKPKRYQVFFSPFSNSLFLQKHGTRLEKYERNIISIRKQFRKLKSRLSRAYFSIKWRHLTSFQSVLN